MVNLVIIILIIVTSLSAISGQGIPPASFELYPSEVEVKELNVGVRFSCVPATGTQPMYYTWLKNGTMIRNSTEGSYRFSLTKDNQGNYRCIVSNAYGALLGRSVTYYAGYFEAAWSTMTRRVLSYSTGVVAKISLPAYTSYPSPTVRWTVDGNDVTSTAYQLRHFVSSLTHELVILDLRNQENNNIYNAHARVIFSRGETKTPSYILQVTGSTITSPLAPQAVIQPQSVTFPFDKISKNVYFECVFNARPLEQLKQLWYFRTTTSAGNPIRTMLQNTLHSSFSNNNRTLKIVDVKESDAGTYECEAHLPGQSVVTKSATLTYLRKATIVSKAPTDLTVKYGERQELSCSSSGNPKPTVRWYRNAKLLGTNLDRAVGNPRYDILSNGSLILRSAVTSDAGIFQCFVENRIGEGMLTVWLKVATAKPSIARGPQNTTVVEGEAATLTCTADGAPTPTVKWFKAGSSTQLVTGGHIKVETSSLRFLTAKTTDSSEYKCEARSMKGVAQASGYLRVQKRTRITRPPAPSISAVLHDKLLIRCGFEHDKDVPVRVEWLLIKISGSTPENVTSGDGKSTANNGTLIIQHVRFAGTYRCKIYSSAGNDTAQTVLTVKELPRKPTMTSANLNTKDKRAVDLTWTPGFDGHAPILEFIITKTEMKLGAAAGPAVVVASVGPTIRSYTVRNLLSSRTYQFCVAAKNEVGQSAHCGASSSILMPQIPPSGPPRSVYATAPSNSTIVVQWSAPLEQHRNGDILGYILRYRAYKYARHHTVNITSAITSRHTLSYLMPFTEYEIQMAAYNAKGIGNFSSPFILRTQEGRPTAAPTNVTVSALSSTSLNVSWKPLLPSDINGINLGYKINLTCLNPTTNCPHKLVKVPPPNVVESRRLISHRINNLHKYAMYRVVIWCYTAKGDGVPSSSAQMQTMEDVPGPVSNLRFENVVGSSIDVYWAPPLSPNGRLSGYQLSYRIRDTTDPKTDLFTLKPTERSKKIVDLRHQTWYIVTVVAFTSKGAGTPSSSSIRSGVPPKKPHAPTGLVCSNPQARSVTLQFTPGFDGNSSISKWIVEAVWQAYTSSTASTVWKEVFSQQAPKANRLIVTKLTPYTRYRIRLIAENIKGRSPPSQPADWFQTHEAPPDAAPQGLITRVTNATSISVRWRPLVSTAWNGVPLGYRVFYRLSGASNYFMRTVSDSNAISLQLTGLQPYTIYEMKIGAFNQRGVGATSNWVRDRTWEAAPGEGPASVHAHSITATTAVVNWTLISNSSSNAQLLGYRVFYQPVSGGSTSKQTLTSPTTQVLTLTALQSFVNYRIQIAAYNRMGDGPLRPQPPLTFKTLASPPSQPTGIYFRSVTRTSVKVAWSPPLHLNGILSSYLLTYRRTDPGVSSATIQHTLPWTDREFSATGLTADAQYEFQVSAVNSKGAGSPVNATVMTTTGRQAPLAPANPSVLNSKSGPDYVTVVWLPRNNNNAPIRNFTLEFKRFSAPPGEWTVVPATITSSQYTIRKLIPFIIYKFRVAANNDVGRSPFSNSTASHRTPGTVPSAAPLIERLEPHDRTTIRIYWKKIPSSAWNERPVGYRIFYKQWMSTGRYLTADVDHSLSDSSLPSLTAGWYYEFRIAAYNAKGQGPQSPPKVVYVGEAKPTAPPSSFACSNITASEIRCSWKSPSAAKNNGDLLGFKIFIITVGMVSSSRRKRSTPSERMVAITSANTSASITGLKPYHQYQVRILAFNPAGDGPNSTSITIATKESIPGPPGKITVNEVTLQSVMLSWNPPAEPNGIITYYRVEYQESNVLPGIARRVEDVVKASSGIQPSFRAQKLTQDTEFIFRVSARTKVGWGSSRNMSVKTGPVPGSPSRPINLRVMKAGGNTELHWRVENSGSGILVGAIIEAQKQGSTDWVLVEYIRTGKPVTSYRASFEKLQPNTLYRFRVSAINSIGISSGSNPSVWVKTPDYDLGPFYKQWWFLVIVALCGLIVIIITVSILSFTGRNRRARARARARTQLKYGYDNNGATLDIPPNCMDRDENGFTSFAMQHQPYGTASIYGTGRRSIGSRTPVSTLPRHGPAHMGAEIHSTLSRKHLKSPPRPSPASVTTAPDDSSDDDSKHPIPSSKGSDSSGTTTRKHQPESDSDYTDEFDDDEFDKIGPPPPISFVGTQRGMTNSSQMRPPNRWGAPGQPGSNNPYSFSDSDTSTLPYQTPNRASLHQAGSRAPIPSYSSFV